MKQITKIQLAKAAILSQDLGDKTKQDLIEKFADLRLFEIKDEYVYGMVNNIDYAIDQLKRAKAAIEQKAHELKLDY